MNEELMRQYIKFIGDRLLTQFGFEKLWNVENPFRLDGFNISKR